ncbi:MAG: hypothetical protein Kow0090_21620 [Myxococcota bacterium]
MRRVILSLVIFTVVFAGSLPLFAQTKFSVAEMARSSENVVVATVTKIDEKSDPPQVYVTVTEALKGPTPKEKKLTIALQPDDIGGKDPVAEPFKNGKSYILFLIQIEDKFAFLFQNLSGKLLVKDKKWLDIHREMIKGIKILDDAASNADRTRKIQKYLKNQSEIVQEWALTEIQIKSMQYEMKTLLPALTGFLNSKNAGVRKRALMAVTRAYDMESEHGYSQDLNLIKILIDGLKDKELEIREFAHQQLRSHTRKAFGYDPKANETERNKTISFWEKWWKEEKQAKEEEGKKQPE